MQTDDQSTPSNGVLRVPPSVDLNHSPGCSLIKADLRPEMLVRELRAQLFSGTNSKIRNTITKGLINSAWSTIKEVESLHSSKCSNISLLDVQTLFASQASNSHESIYAQIEQEIKKKPNNSDLTKEQTELLQKQADLDLAHRNSEINNNNVLGDRGLIPRVYNKISGNIPENSRIVGSEKWTIDRCSVKQDYEVIYYAKENAFYSKVAPTTMSGLYDFTKLQFNGWLFPHKKWQK